jgi:hypothetical protein
LKVLCRVKTKNETHLFFYADHWIRNKQIIHRWLYAGEEKAAVTLNIGGDSSHTIRVNVCQGTGKENGKMT